MTAFVADDAVCPRTVVYLARPVGVRLDLVHLVRAGLFIGDLFIRDDRHAVDDFAELFIQIMQIGIIFIAVFRVEFREVDAAKALYLMLGQSGAEALELLKIGPRPRKWPRKTMRIPWPCRR